MSRSSSRRLARHPLPALLTPLAALLLCGAIAAQAPTGDPREVADPRETADPRDGGDPRGTEREPDPLLEGAALYDALWEAGDTARLKETLTRDAWFVLGYIDAQCEAWLASIETGAAETGTGHAKTDALAEKARALAQMADDGIGDTRFSLYVSTILGWTPEQRGTYREGQQLYRSGLALYMNAETPEKAREALTPLRQAHDRARVLGDTWGQATALALIGRVQAANQLESEARATMGEALAAAREIRDFDSVWDALSITYESSMRSAEFQPARDALVDQYRLALEVGAQDTARNVLQQIVELEQWLDKAGLR